MNQEEKIRNSIRAYILGDCLGVPYEFLEEGTFTPESFRGFGTHNKPSGTWSDDTSILLCLLDAFSQANAIEAYKDNLKRWYFKGDFTVDGLFDIGDQTSKAIINGFTLGLTDNMGNGALFYSLPLAIVSLYSKVDFKQWCSITHNNINCFVYGAAFKLLLESLLSDTNIPVLNKTSCKNKGDVKNTYKLVINEFIKLGKAKTNITEDLLKIISHGNDTDTNAAFLGALLGTRKSVQEEDWQKIKRYKYIDTVINRFLEQF